MNGWALNTSLDIGYLSNISRVYWLVITDSDIQCESKKSTPEVFWHFPQTVGNF